jgi:hypothetical protein
MWNSVRREYLPILIYIYEAVMPSEEVHYINGV